jgi:hypothetical protein
MPSRGEEQGLKAGRIQVTLGTQLITCALLVALAQVILWLSQGEWPAFSVAEILRWAGATMPMVGGSGFNSVLAWLLALPISAAIAGVGFVVAWMGASKLVAASNEAAARN